MPSISTCQVGREFRRDGVDNFGVRVFVVVYAGAGAAVRFCCGELDKRLGRHCCRPSIVFVQYETSVNYSEYYSLAVTRASFENQVLSFSW